MQVEENIFEDNQNYKRKEQFKTEKQIANKKYRDKFYKVLQELINSQVDRKTFTKLYDLNLLPKFEQSKI